MKTSLLIFILSCGTGIEYCVFPENILQLITQKNKAITLFNANELIVSWPQFVPGTDCPTLINGDGKMDYCALVHNGKERSVVCYS